MTVELSAEEIVTNLLSEQQILKQSKSNFYITNQGSLGEFLKHPQEDSNITILQNEALNKYRFIKNKWVI